MGQDRLAFYKPALKSVVFREISPFVLFFCCVCSSFSGMQIRFRKQLRWFSGGAVWVHKLLLLSCTLCLNSPGIDVILTQQ